MPSKYLYNGGYLIEWLFLLGEANILNSAAHPSYSDQDWRGIVLELLQKLPKQHLDTIKFLMTHLLELCSVQVSRGRLLWNPLEPEDPASKTPISFNLDSEKNPLFFNNTAPPIHPQPPPLLLPSTLSLWNPLGPEDPSPRPPPLHPQPSVVASGTVGSPRGSLDMPRCVTRRACFLDACYWA